MQTTKPRQKKYYPVSFGQEFGQENVWASLRGSQQYAKGLRFAARSDLLRVGPKAAGVRLGSAGVAKKLGVSVNTLQKALRAREEQ